MSEQANVNELSNREHKKVFDLLTDTYAQDKESFLEDLAERLDIEVEDLPEVSVVVHLTIGKQTVKASGFEAAEVEDEDDEDF